MDLNDIWIDVTGLFLTLSFLFFICCLIWQHIKNKREQKELISNYNKNLKILENLKNRF